MFSWPVVRLARTVPPGLQRSAARGGTQRCSTFHVQLAHACQVSCRPATLLAAELGPCTSMQAFVSGVGMPGDTLWVLIKGCRLAISLQQSSFWGVCGRTCCNGCVAGCPVSRRPADFRIDDGVWSVLSGIAAHSHAPNVLSYAQTHTPSWSMWHVTM